MVVLEPDVAKAFGDSATVNKALRSLLDFSSSTQRLTKRSTPRKKKTAKSAWAIDYRYHLKVQARDRDKTHPS